HRGMAGFQLFARCPFVFRAPLLRAKYLFPSADDAESCQSIFFLFNWKIFSGINATATQRIQSFSPLLVWRQRMAIGLQVRAKTVCGFAMPFMHHLSH